jgi:hypothetical protein
MSDDPLEDGDLRLYVFQLGNGCMDTANEMAKFEKGTGLEVILSGLAEILHRLAHDMPYKEEIVAERLRREKLRKTK